MEQPLSSDEEARQNPELGPLSYDATNIDTLTRLPNRAVYDEAIADAMERFPGQFALVLLDSDGLKAINDDYGHAAGNEYIIGTAKALQNSVREADLTIVIRLGGDEFAILLPGVSRQDDLKRIIVRIQSQLDGENKPISVGGKVHTPGETADELFKMADLLLKNNKLDRAYNGSTHEQRLFALETVAEAERLGMRVRDVAKLAAAAALHEAGLDRAD